MAALSFLILFFPVLAFAQTHRVGGCPTLEKHESDVEYKPGVDTKGWAVAPADLNQPAISTEQFNSASIDLDIPASDYSDNEALNHHAPFAEIDLGQMTINRDKPSEFNGKPMGNTEIITNPDCD